MDLSFLILLYADFDESDELPTKQVAQAFLHTSDCGGVPVKLRSEVIVNKETGERGVSEDLELAFRKRATTILNDILRRALNKPYGSK